MILVAFAGRVHPGLVHLLVRRQFTSRLCALAALSVPCELEPAIPKPSCLNSGTRDRPRHLQPSTKVSLQVRFSLVPPAPEDMCIFKVFSYRRQKIDCGSHSSALFTTRPAMEFFSLLSLVIAWVVGWLGLSTGFWKLLVAGGVSFGSDLSRDNALSPPNRLGQSSGLWHQVILALTSSSNTPICWSETLNARPRNLGP